MKALVILMVVLLTACGADVRHNAEDYVCTPEEMERVQHEAQWEIDHTAAYAHPAFIGAMNRICKLKGAK